MNFRKPRNVIILVTISLSVLVIQMLTQDWHVDKSVPISAFMEDLVDQVVTINSSSNSIFYEKWKNIENDVFESFLYGKQPTTLSKEIGVSPKFIDGCPDNLFVLADGGGMGNRFFQYLHAKVLAASMKRNLTISQDLYNYLGNYFTGIDHQLYKSIKAIEEVCGPAFEKVKMQTQTQLNLQEEPYIALIHGWISQYSSTLWKLFLSRRSELLEPIQWRPELKENVATYINLTTVDRPYSKLIGIHVRSPQYKKHLKSFKKYVKMAGATYFKNAMNYFREKFSNPIFMVVSDDMEWCRRTIKGSDVIYAGRGNVNDPGWDMALLTSCDHLINTYGSYGIMAAYFLAGNAEVITADRFTRDRYTFVEQLRGAEWPNWHWMSV